MRSQAQQSPRVYPQQCSWETIAAGSRVEVPVGYGPADTVSFNLGATVPMWVVMRRRHDHH
jgi:hypothetical protein